MFYHLDNIIQIMYVFGPIFNKVKICFLKEHCSILRKESFLISSAVLSTNEKSFQFLQAFKYAGLFRQPVIGYFSYESVLTETVFVPIIYFAPLQIKTISYYIMIP